MKFLEKYKNAISIGVGLLVIAAFVYYFIIVPNQTDIKLIVGMDIKDGLLYEEKIKENKPEFIAKLNAVSAALGIKPNWLMMVMNKESGVNHRIVNPNGGATGLIQFMPATARALGTTTEALKNMTNVQQLDYVQRYFMPYKKYIKSYADLYLVTFFPAALGQAENWIFQAPGLSAESVGKANPAINNGRIIDMQAFKAYLFRGVSDTVKPLLV